VKRPLLVIGLGVALAACATPRPHPVAPAAPAAAVTAPPADPGGVLVAAATAVLGHPYRYGGSAPGGFDCSGLVAYAAGIAGLRLPRTAAEQLRSGMPVDRHDLRSGDLVFMHLSRKGLHVGVAIDNGHFVHAPSNGGYVRIDSLSAAPYARGFIGARRIVTQTAAPRMQ
jgi:cell wall-associated NlpC family hydrolase